MRKGWGLRVGSAFVAAMLAVGAMSAPSSAKNKHDDVRVTVTLAPMNFVPDSSPQAPQSQTLTQDAATTVTKTFTGAPAEVEAQIARWKHEAVTEGVVVEPEPGTVQIMKRQVIFGDCGWSSIELKDPDSYKYDKSGYLKAEISLDRPGTTYNVDVLIFSSSATDLWTAHVRRTGSLNGGTYWSTSGRVDVPKAQNYGATLVTADVATTGGTCRTAGPRVDDVYIN
jgi:hypothetical protein